METVLTKISLALVGTVSIFIFQVTVADWLNYADTWAAVITPSPSSLVQTW